VLEQIVRGPLLIATDDGRVEFHRDGALAADEHGVIQFAGEWAQLKRPAGAPPVRVSDGTMLPPLLDAHTHISQHPIRGRFVEGVPVDAPGGRLLSGLKRNVFPAEARCNDVDHARKVVRDFHTDTLAHGVVGGATYMTVSAAATEAALEILPDTWSVGLVLMNQNTPDDLRTDEPNLEAEVKRMAERFGRRLIVTDRFAVAVTSPLRRRAVRLAEKFGLRTQTHLNEQIGEKEFVERRLYPDAANYTSVYRQDGLLDHDCILAHCIQMTDEEWPMIVETNSVIAHCPTSNLLLGSGVMPLDRVIELGIAYAIGTDVGASPTVSLLAEMGRFLQVHAGRSARATPNEALLRTTLAPAKILGLDQQMGRLREGQPMSFIEVNGGKLAASAGVDEAIRALLPADLDHPAAAVTRVTLAGKTIFRRSHGHA